MPFPLSYPGLKCVLEHLEAVKRAHIIARAPGLQKIDKLIPFCLESFYIANDTMTINKLLIEYDKDGVKFGMNGKTFSHKGLVSRKDSMKKLAHFYICGRSIIYVDRLNWRLSLLPDFLPVGMKFRVNSLSVFSHWEFETAIRFIDPRSFPLKTMITLPDTSTYDNNIATSAETLILLLVADPIVTVEDLKKLNNKRVEFERFRFSKIDMIPLIKYQIETKKATGTTLVIAADGKGFIKKMLRKFQKAFGEYRSDLDDVNERFIPGSYKFSIPINDESRIQVYAIEDRDESDRWKIVIKPVSEVLGL